MYDGIHYRQLPKFQLGEWEQICKTISSLDRPISSSVKAFL